MVQKTINSIDDFPGTLEKDDSFNRDLLPDAMKYLKKMFDRRMIYGYSPYASNFAIDSEKQCTFDSSGNYTKGPPGLLPLFGGCHGAFNHSYKRNVTFFINWFYRTRSKDTCHQFYDWILDPKESPWRDALQNTTVLRDEENDIPVCVIFRNLANEDIHLVTNFLIATRMNTEFNAADLWAKLIEFGFTEAEAYALQPNFYIQRRFAIMDARYQTLGIFDKTPWGKNAYGEKYEHLTGYRISYGPFATGDRPFYANFCSKRFIDKNPSVRAKPQYLRNGCTPNPCNYVWGGTEARGDRTNSQLFQMPTEINIPRQGPGAYTAKDIFGFWNQEPKKPPREKIQYIKKLLSIPKNKRKESIDLSA